MSQLTKKITFAFMSLIALAAIVFWIGSGFGLKSGKNQDSGTLSTGASGISSLIQKQTNKFKEQKQAIDNQVNQQLKSQALLLPKGLLIENEQPQGVFYLNSRFIENGVTSELTRIEFYQNTTAAYFRVTLDQDKKIFLSAALGSALQQKLPGIETEITYQPIFQTGSPARLKPGEALDVTVLFRPIAAQEKFDLVMGDFMTDQDPNLAEHFNAHFSIDPQQIIKSKSDAQNLTKDPNNGSVVPIQ